MSAENAFPVDAARRRRRRTAILLVLIGALMASAFVAERLFRSSMPGATAWTSDTVFPKLKDYFAGKHGVTVPIARKLVRTRYTGQGGPEDPGAYIEEDGIALAGIHDPIGSGGDFALPSGRLGGLNRFGPGDGGPLGSGGGGGGPGGGIIACEKSDGGAMTVSEIDKLCPGNKTASEPDAKADNPGKVVNDTLGEAGGGGGGGSGPTYTLPGSPGIPEIVGPGAPQIPAGVPVSAVPEPQSWLMMITGFLLMGLGIRHRGMRTVGRSRAT